MQGPRVSAADDAAPGGWPPLMPRGRPDQPTHRAFPPAPPRGCHPSCWRLLVSQKPSPPERRTQIPPDVRPWQRRPRDDSGRLFPLQPPAPRRPRSCPVQATLPSPPSVVGHRHRQQSGRRDLSPRQRAPEELLASRLYLFAPRCVASAPRSSELSCPQVHTVARDSKAFHQFHISPDELHLVVD